MAVLSGGFFLGALATARQAFDFQVHSVALPGVISSHTAQTCTSTDKNKREFRYTCYQYRVRYELQGTSTEAPVEDVRTSHPDRLGEAVDLRVDPRMGTVFFAGLGPWWVPLILSLFGFIVLAVTVHLLKSG